MAISNERLYELLWSATCLSVHRYGGNPSGEVLLVLTILLLDQAGRHVTMSELAEITGLPKSNVSRYVSNQLRSGHLTEQIDPRDRRRRVLHPTNLGQEEQKRHRERLLQLSKLRQASRGDQDSDFDLARLLTEMRRHFQDAPAKDAASG